MELRVLSIRADAIIYKYNVYSIYNLVYVIIIMAWVCGRSLAGIAGSNPAGGIDVCLLWVLCVVR
jgi:hypothetical protein